MPAPTRLRTGFTLLEVMTTVVILLILAGLAVTFAVYGTDQARMNNAVFDVAALVNSAQLRALSRGSPQYLFLHQTPDHRVRLLVLERLEDTPTPDWNALDLTQSPEEALASTHALPDGTPEAHSALLCDELVLGTRTGADAGGLAFLDLDSSRIPKPLPAPFNAIALTTPLSTPASVNAPTLELMAGCNFCVEPSGHPYGVLRFNPDGTLQVLTGDAPSGAVIAFAPSGADERDVVPKLLTVSAPAAATVVF